jgi:hypothetical protein
MDEESRKRKNREACKRYRERHPGQAAVKQQAYREANPEKSAATARVCSLNYYYKHKETPGFLENNKKNSKAWYENRFKNGGWALYRFINCRDRNKKLGLAPTDVTKDYLLELFQKQGGRCYYTKVPFRMQMGIFTPSVDRKDPKQGYYKSNIVLCLAGVNYAKNDASVEEFTEFLREIKDHLDD